MSGGVVIERGHLVRGKFLPPPPPPVPEKDFRRQVMELARMLGWLCYFTGCVIFVELKAEKGRLTPPQRKWLWALAASGARTHLWRPSSWPLIERILKGER